MPTFDRRTFLKSASLAALATPLARRAMADTVSFAPKAGAPRKFELVTRVEIAAARGPARVWIPVPAQNHAGWFGAEQTSFSGNAAHAALKTGTASRAAYVEASWNDETDRVLEVTSRFWTRNRAAGASAGEQLGDAERAFYLQPTKLAPTDGIVKETSDAIVRGARTEIDKLRAIYEWVVDHTHRNAATRGCGTGDVVAMLKSGAGSMGGKCADINPLMVALARSAGIPARDLYGIRIAPSQFGYRSLGAGTANVTKAQHCRAEAYIEGVGWFPVDPADVRKVALEEPPGNLAMTSDKVLAARKALFGAWESNWLSYNDARDVRLSDADGGTLPFLMYPQAEVAGRMLDCLDPDAFRYTITAREIAI